MTIVLLGIMFILLIYILTVLQQITRRLDEVKSECKPSDIAGAGSGVITYFLSDSELWEEQQKKDRAKEKGVL